MIHFKFGEVEWSRYKDHLKDDRLADKSSTLCKYKLAAQDLCRRLRKAHQDVPDWLLRISPSNRREAIDDAAEKAMHRKRLATLNVEQKHFFEAVMGRIDET